MIPIYIYYAILAAAVLLASFYGGSWERGRAYIVLAASFATTWAAPALLWNFWDGTVALINLIMLLSFWLIAIRSGRHLLYWFTAWQLISLMAHVHHLAFDEIQPISYSFLTMDIVYPILTTITFIFLINMKNRKIHPVRNRAIIERPNQ
jgi:hypothetical protein